MKLIIYLLLLAACSHENPSNAIEKLGEEVIQKHEGIDIKLTPVDAGKEK